MVESFHGPPGEVRAGPSTASLASVGSNGLHPERSWLFAPRRVTRGELDLLACLLIWVLENVASRLRLAQ